ncbi:hypothetical protein GQ43DRAFT_384643 [Delitschia confertaspora ATCC 74209]|uniref:UBX domain-containing protein n=1 Tax=Delitschia confertaspora ATCC 74209 TaxID=1513339 RepID=A0A9P4MU14_9PLEO|nr:hypothetical protein GQ43DRAFT_384643 [Delitschia confertaspora ATCC 74209]
MFHEGDLQSGITRAISEQKSVACFVRDHTPESLKWENQWLHSAELSNLTQSAVILRLEAGSTEAGFLTAFCPISKTPSIVVIRNGQLQEQLVSGITEDEFIGRLSIAVAGEQIERIQPTSEATSPAGAAASIQAVAGDLREQAASTSARTEADAYTNVMAMSDRAKGKQKVDDSTSSPDSSSTQRAVQKARESLQRKKQGEQDELKRIQARIEADKAERKAQSEARKAERKFQEQQDTRKQSLPRSSSSKASSAKEVHLNVRLFDGHRISSIFPRTATLQDDVRPWIGREFSAKAENPNERHPPYMFKQILAPLPSKELSTSDEGAALGDIDLAPSATLVLIPVKRYVDAYGASGGGIVSGVTGLVGAVVGLVSSTVGYGWSTLSSLVAFGSQAQGGNPNEGKRLDSAPENPPATSAGSSVRVRTLADQRRGEPRRQFFYNGNQTNFEPNYDDNDESRR